MAKALCLCAGLFISFFPLSAVRGLAQNPVALNDMSTKRNQEGAASGAPTLGDIMRTFKSISAVTVNRRLDRPGVPLWQRNYYEHIIRNDRDLQHITDYINANPLRWNDDDENPVNVQPS